MIELNKHTKGKPADVAIDLYYDETKPDSTIARKPNYFNKWGPNVPNSLRDRLERLKDEGYTGVRIHVFGSSVWSEGSGSLYQMPTGTHIIFDGIDPATLRLSGIFYGISRISGESPTGSNVIRSTSGGDSWIETNRSTSQHLVISGNVLFTGTTDNGPSLNIAHSESNSSRVVVKDGVALLTGSVNHAQGAGIDVRGSVGIQENVSASSGDLNINLQSKAAEFRLHSNQTTNTNIYYNYSGMRGSGPSSTVSVGTSYTDMLQNSYLNRPIHNIEGNQIEVFAGILALGDTDKEYDVQLVLQPGTANESTVNIVGIPARVANGVDASVFYTVKILIRSSDMVIYSCARQEWGDVFFVDSATIARPSASGANPLLDLTLRGRKGVAADTFDVEHYYIDQKL